MGRKLTHMGSKEIHPSVNLQSYDRSYSTDAMSNPIEPIINIKEQISFGITTHSSQVNSSLNLG